MFQQFQFFLIKMFLDLTPPPFFSFLQSTREMMKPFANDTIVENVVQRFVFLCSNRFTAIPMIQTSPFPALPLQYFYSERRQTCVAAPW